ncbi:SLIT-ROBO Rho GTPase-activating protein 3-like [Clytia hemisphaerica]|uniref:Uncharacterized protein n=1 Tax=Clytia hemisphaerica TaxID=252671 RepID=A0A7M6DL23_9CNID|eukprot:TCONS_00016909-protein
MASALNRKDKQILMDFDASVRDFGKQLGDQQRVLDSRTENKTLLVNDLQEFFKRRAEIDLEYGKSMDRLCDRFTERFQKQRSNYGLAKKDRASFVNLWHKLLIDTKFKAKTATTLSEIFNKNICQRLVDISDDVQRIARKVKETQVTLQGEVNQLVSQLQADMKHYYTKHAEYIISEGKYRASESDHQKVLDSPMKKGNEKKMKNMEKTVEKRRARFVECKLKAARARNAFILGAESVSSIIHKYYNNDLTDMIGKYDHNFHSSFSSTLQSFIGAEIRMSNANIQSANSLAHTISIMDCHSDIKMFLEDNHSTFLPQVKFTFLPHAEDETHTITADRDIESELRHEYHKIQESLKQLQMELHDLQVSMEKRKKGLETTYKKYDSDMNGFYHMDMLPVSGAQTKSPTDSQLQTTPPSQLKQEKEEWETSLLSKFRESIMSEMMRTGEQSKYDLLTKALGEITSDPSRLSIIPDRKKRIKLFGTGLKQQIDETGREIPDIVESCAKYIAKYGLKHQGIFRVPGASQEISDMKTSFEEGRDPLSGLNHWKDINAVAGVFRVYFREMSEPLFPYEFNNDYLRASCITRTDEQVAEARSILQKIQQWNLHVIKYMLKFLNLIAQYSEHNKMTSHNLAVVFGPTLFRVPDNENLLTSQGQINAFIGILISEFYSIFPDEPHEIGFEDKTDGGTKDDGDEDGAQTEDELSEDEADDYIDVVALYNYTARTTKEVSFNKGDIIRVFSRTNVDWWDARVNGKFGFVPVPYVKVLERPASVSDVSASGNMTGRRKSHEHLTSPKSPNESESSPSSPNNADPKSFAAFNPATQQLKSASTSSVGSTGEHVGNVFAALDPTVRPVTASPSSIRRSGSDRSGVSGGRVGSLPNRSQSERFGANGRSRIAETDAENSGNDPQLQHTLNKVSTAFSQTKQPILPPSLPPSAAKQYMAGQNAENKIKEETETESEPSSSTFMPRSSVKDRTKMFHNTPIMCERPPSGLGLHKPPTPGQHGEAVPSFKPPPPPTALKPKPGRKNQELAQAVMSAATKKAQQQDKDNVTHL